MAQHGSHSVLGGREKARGTFREFITYDDSACYAEYIISYEREFGENAVTARDHNCREYRERLEREAENVKIEEEKCTSLFTEQGFSSTAEVAVLRQQRSGLNETEDTLTNSNSLRSLSSGRLVALSEDQVEPDF